jgi:hypothetical protein
MKTQKYPAALFDQRHQLVKEIEHFRPASGHEKLVIRYACQTAEAGGGDRRNLE